MAGFDKFTSAFLDFLDDRSTHEEFISHNEKFQDELSKLEDYYEQIRQKLNLPKGNAEGRELDFMDEVDDHVYHVITKAVDAGYRQGFSEGIKLILMSLMLDH